MQTFRETRLRCVDWLQILPERSWLRTRFAPMSLMLRRHANWASSSESCWSSAGLETSLRRSAKVALHGKTILTTRAAAHSGDLSERLTELGARVVECPTIELEPLENWAAVDEAISRIHSYQWM